MWTDAAVVVAGYLLGSIPFAYLVTRAVTGKDLRIEGEGNVGARNAMRTAGRVPGLLVFLLDGSKGAAAYWVGQRFGSGELVLYLTGFAMMLGHGFPLWLRWRGGKGLAAAVGFLSQMWPYSVLAGLAVFLLAQALLPVFDGAVAAGAGTMFVLSFVEGNSLKGVLFIVFFLGMAGLKRLIDLPYERSTSARSGWVEGPRGIHRKPDQNARR